MATAAMTRDQRRSAVASLDPAMLDLVGRGETILFVGAGFAVVPDDRRTTRDRQGLKEFLAERYRGTLRGVSARLASWSLEDLVAYVRGRGVSKQEVADVLKGFLLSNAQLARLESFSLLQTLVRLQPNLFEAIITTNWDKGLECALQPVSRFRRIVADRDCLSYDPSVLTLLKIHGDVDDAESVVLSAHEFDTYEKEHPRVVERLRMLFSTKYVVILGYGLRDDNFRRILRSLQHDLRGDLRGGWIVTPHLGDHEKIWTPLVNLKHVEAAAQDFLKGVLSAVVRVPLGTSSRRAPRGGENEARFEVDTALSKLARGVRRMYGLGAVWVARLRTNVRPNEAIGRLGAYYIESECRNARSIGISTGETMEALANAVDTSVFRHRVSIFPTVVVLAGPRNFKDPSYVAQTLTARFKPGRGTGIALRLPDGAYLRTLLPRSKERLRQGWIEAIRRIALAQVAKAIAADVVVASVRAPEWFGGGDVPGTRTMPVQWIPSADPRTARRAMREAGVVAVHQMMLLDNHGNEVTERTNLPKVLAALRHHVCRPTREQMRQAASRRRVITVACGKEKTESVVVVLCARLTNVLVVDEALAVALLETKPHSAGGIPGASPRRALASHREQRI